MSFTPTLTPAYASVGQSQQNIIIEYSCDVSPHMFLTIIPPNLIDRNNSTRVPANLLGPKAVKVKLPSFYMYGTYTVVPVFPVNPDPKFPPFELQVLSPIQSLINALLPPEDEDPYNVSPLNNVIVAAVLVYLIQTEDHGIESTEMIDNLLSQILPAAMDRRIMSIPQFLCGKYVHSDETLLHYCIRHNYLSSCEYLSQNLHTGFSESLSMVGFDGKTSLELAEKLKMHRLSGIIKEHLERAKLTTEHDSSIQTEAHGGSHKSYQLLSKKFDRLKFAIKKEIKERKTKLEDSSENKQSITQDVLKNLKITALYSAEVVEPYSIDDKDFGNVSIQLGDVAFVTREEDKNWCTGIVNDKFCRFPINILQGASYKKYIGASDRIPEPKDLMRNSQEIRDTEDLDHLVSQHRKYVDYMKEKQDNSASKRLTHLIPVTRSNSMDSGLDEINNCSPFLKRRPLPPNPLQQQDPTYIYSGERKGVNHRNIPLPATPTPDDDSSGDEYEEVDLSPKGLPNVSSIRPSPLLKRKINPNLPNSQSPVQHMKRKSESTTEKRKAQHNNGHISSTTLSPNINRTSIDEDDIKRSSMISNKSSDSGIYENTRSRLPSIASQSNEAEVKQHRKLSETSVGSDDDYVDAAGFQSQKIPPNKNIKPKLNIANIGNKPDSTPSDHSRNRNIDQHGKHAPPQPPPKSLKPKHNDPATHVTHGTKPQLPLTCLKPLSNTSGHNTTPQAPQPPQKQILAHASQESNSETQNEISIKLPMKPIRTDSIKQPPPLTRPKPSHNSKYDATVELPESCSTNIHKKNIKISEKPKKKPLPPLPEKNSPRGSPQSMRHFTSNQSAIATKEIVSPINSSNEIGKLESSPENDRQMTIKELKMKLSYQ